MSHIRIVRASGKWTIRASGAVIGESTNALELLEGDYPAVIYFPRSDVAMAFLEPTDKVTHCPHKGEASYFSIEAKNRTLENAVWSYENPKETVAAIKDHLGFHTGDYLTVEQV
ncbi:MAG: DUF427 domain-containing protein [Marinovum sp.]|nr:DUF427 domain-containing protein [Marinovum sp.]